MSTCLFNFETAQTETMLQIVLLCYRCISWESAHVFCYISECLLLLISKPGHWSGQFVVVLIYVMKAVCAHTSDIEVHPTSPGVFSFAVPIVSYS